MTLKEILGIKETGEERLNRLSKRLNKYILQAKRYAWSNYSGKHKIEGHGIEPKVDEFYYLLEKRLDRGHEYKDLREDDIVYLLENAKGASERHDWYLGATYISDVTLALLNVNARDRLYFTKESLQKLSNDKHLGFAPHFLKHGKWIYQENTGSELQVVDKYYREENFYGEMRLDNFFPDFGRWVTPSNPIYKGYVRRS